MKRGQIIVIQWENDSLTRGDIDLHLCKLMQVGEVAKLLKI